MADVFCVAEAADEDTLVRVLAAARRSGARDIEAISPFPLDRKELPQARVREKAVAATGLLGGVSGGIFAYWLQWYINLVDYPLNVGGRPLHSAPAFIPLTFETTVLVAGVSIFIAFFVASRMPRLAHPSFALHGIERATSDRFFVCAVVDVAGFPRLRDALVAAGALRVGVPPATGDQGAVG